MLFNSQFLRRVFSSTVAFVVSAGVYVVVAGDVRADMLPGARCNPGFDSRANVTWYGNSWGDFVDVPTYGWGSWETYFRFHHPEVDWRIQNLAVGGRKTVDVFGEILRCARTLEDRNQYRTASNVVLEIGGNDYIQHLPALIFAPWMYPRIQQRVLQNTEAILVSLKHPRRHKNVLVVGHIPVVTTSPSLGKPGDYFQPWGVQPSGANLKSLREIEEKKRGSYQDQLADATLQAKTQLLGADFENDLSTRLGFQVAPGSFVPLYDSLLSGSRCLYLAWYCAWLDLNAWDLGMSALSLAMLLHQGPMESVARRNDSEFLPMYPYFIREVDCMVGSCWVAKHLLYSDPIHKNYLGYFLYSYQVSNKLVELGWQNIMPANGGLIDSPAVEIPGSEEGAISGPVVPPNDLDFLILLCLFSGACW